jgi:hypothetical protein
MQRVLSDNPWRSLAELLRRQKTGTDHTADCRWADCKNICRLIERDLASRFPFAFLIGSDALLAANGTYAHSRPAVAATSVLPEPV